MTFDKKLKIRTIFAIIFILSGLIFIALSLCTGRDISSTGLVFVVIGIARIKKIFTLKQNEKKLSQAKLAEEDERNIMLWTKARGLTLSIFIIVQAIAVIVFQFLKMYAYSTALSYSILGIMIIYWICYIILSRKY